MSLRYSVLSIYQDNDSGSCGRLGFQNRGKYYRTSQLGSHCLSHDRDIYFMHTKILIQKKHKTPRSGNDDNGKKVGREAS